MIIDKAVFGGGISGLYLWNKLGDKTHLFEKKMRIGGRIKTISSKIPKMNEDYWVDTGAARINANHKKTLRLVKELGLQDKLEEFNFDYDYYIRGEKNEEILKKFNFGKYEYLKKNVKNPQDIIPKILTKLKTKIKNKKELINFTPSALINQYFNQEVSQFVQLTLGYTAKLENTNTQTFIND